MRVSNLLKQNIKIAQNQSRSFSTVMGRDITKCRISQTGKSSKTKGWGFVIECELSWNFYTFNIWIDIWNRAKMSYTCVRLFWFFLTSLWWRGWLMISKSVIDILTDWFSFHGILVLELLSQLITKISPTSSEQSTGGGEKVQAGRGGWWCGRLWHCQQVCQQVQGGRGLCHRSVLGRGLQILHYIWNQK